MRYFSLGMVAVGALMFPFAAKRAVLGYGAAAGHDLRTALVLLIIGALLVAAGMIVAKQDETTSKWRNRARGTRRLRLR